MAEVLASQFLTDEEMQVYAECDGSLHCGDEHNSPILSNFIENKLKEQGDFGGPESLIESAKAIISNNVLPMSATDDSSCLVVDIYPECTAIPFGDESFADNVVGELVVKCPKTCLGCKARCCSEYSNQCYCLYFDKPLRKIYQTYKDRQYVIVERLPECIKSFSK